MIQALKIIKELYLEHLKSPCACYLTWLFLDLMEKKSILGTTSSVSEQELFEIITSLE